MYEAGVPEPTIQAMAGHTSARMSRAYNRTRQTQLVAAAAVLDSGRRGEKIPDWHSFAECEVARKNQEQLSVDRRILTFSARAGH